MRAVNILVEVKNKENIDRAFKRFKKKIEKIGILNKVRDRSYYKKPSVARREARLKSIHRRNMLHTGV